MPPVHPSFVEPSAPTTHSRSARMIRASSLVAVVSLGAVACGGSSETSRSATVERDSIGDTLVVRTVAGSSWGEGTGRLVPETTIGVLDGPEEFIFGNLRAIAVAPDGRIMALDGQIPALRVYDADGNFVQTIGRDGEGPGEFGQPDSGLVILSDGRIVVRDPGNARLQVFDGSGEALDTWSVIPGGFNTSNPMLRARGDTLLTPVLVDRDADVTEWEMGLQRTAPDGSIVDTLRQPDAGFEAPRIEARRESESGSSVSINGVPFSPDEQVAFHPDGFFIHGINDSYSFTLLRPGGFIRIERAVDPAPVAAGEKESAEANATRNMRGMDPNWRWNGAPIPDVKPAYAALYAAEDGRIWVMVEGRGVERDNPDFDPADPESPETVWRSRYAFDIFDPDGTFVGRVDVPEDLGRFPTPVIRGDQLWGVTRDDLGVQRIVRYRLTAPATGA